MKLLGLHHITAITADPKRNVEFYTRVLGLRLVKKTVNFDDPSSYHFYYGDNAASPGGLITFFAWTQLRRGRVGQGQAAAIAYAIDRRSVPFWQERLRTLGVSFTQLPDRFGEPVLAFADPDGLPIELIGTDPGALPSPQPTNDPALPAEHQIRGFHAVTLAVTSSSQTIQFLTETMNAQLIAQKDQRARLRFSGSGPAPWVDVLADSRIPLGRPGSGTVHHVAFHAVSDQDELVARDELLKAHVGVSPVMDRTYFHSIYYPEPNGILFEIATSGPGFTVDEPAESLGTSLKLPTRYEPHREQIQALLPPLD